MLGIGAFKQRMPTPDQALPGRAEPLPLHNVHHVHGRPLRADSTGTEFEGLERVAFGMGCFWGAERVFWSLPGVYTTAVGYAGGLTPNPTYEEVCSGLTGHTEVVLVVFDPQQTSFEALLKVFWEVHNPTQGMRQGNDQGTQYRSAIYCQDDAQLSAAKASQARGAAQQPLQHVAVKAIVVPHLARTHVGEERHKGVQDARRERVSTQLGHAGGRHAAAQEAADGEAALRQVGGSGCNGRSVLRRGRGGLVITHGASAILGCAAHRPALAGSRSRCRSQLLAPPRQCAGA